MKYLAQRLGRAIVLLFGVSIMCFAFMEIAPGSFFDEMRLNPQISPQTLAAMRARYGLDRPVMIRYFRWAFSALHGDFGYSLAYNSPVAPILWSRAKNTLLLASVAVLLIWAIGLPLGVLTGSSRGKIMDWISGCSAALLLAIPEIVLAIALLAVAIRWRGIPVGGMFSLNYEDISPRAKLWDVLLHMVLPVSILVLGGVAVVERHVRASVREALDAPCIRAARGLGISKTRFLFRHALPLAAHPAISLLGLSLAGLLGGSLIVEAITGWPGIGPLILEATLARDLYVVIAVVMLSAGFMVAGNLVADLLLFLCDPRVRTGDTHA
jgi:peptide/nickel transport system permease protein